MRCIAGAALAFVAGGKLRLADLARDLVAQLLLDLRHQDPRSFLAGHVGNPLELLFLLADAVVELSANLVQPLLLAAELALAPVEILALTVEVLLLGKKALFDLL